jgi:hypothetical protein
VTVELGHAVVYCITRVKEQISDDRPKYKEVAHFSQRRIGQYNGFKVSSTALDICNCSVIRTASTHKVIRMDEQVETQSVTFLSSVCPGLGDLGLTVVLLCENSQ